MKKFFTFLFLLIIIKNTGAQQVVINEIQSSNWGIIYANGEAEDWIELKNKTNSAIDLSAFCLSDNRQKPTMWRFPSGTTIAAQSLIIVYASGKNRIQSGKIHTNFKLDSYQSELLLTDTNGNIIDFHEASGITSKTSWARIPDGGNNWCILGTPTPGASNGNGSCITQFCRPPVVSTKPGIYTTGKMQLTIWCPDSGEFYYTLDGRTPPSSGAPNNSNTWKKTSGSTITLDTGSCVLKIRPVKAGKHPGRIWVGTYLVKQPKITLGYISVSLNPDSFSWLYANYSSQDIEKEGYVQYYDKNGNLLTQFGANISIHGNYSSSFPQKSLRIETRQWLDSSKIQYQLYPNKKIYEFKNFNLRNAGVDWMRRHCSDGITMSLARRTNNDIEDQKIVLGYVNGKYFGVFEIKEKQDNDYCAENHDVNPDSIDMLRYSGMIQYGKDSAWNALVSKCNSLNLTVDSNFNKVAKYVDLDNWIDYFCTEIYIANTDWPGNNIRWWRPQRADGKWRYCLWDLDFGWGIPWASGEIAVTTDLLTSIISGGLPISDLLTNPTFKKKFINRYADLMNTIFRFEKVNGLVNVHNEMKAVFDTLDKEMPRAFSRWNTSSVSGTASSYSDWKTKFTAMGLWASRRPQYARSHVKNDFSIVSDTVNLTLQVSPSGAGLIRINTIIPALTPTWKGTYFNGVPVVLTAIPNPGYKFSNWNINGNDTLITTSKNFTSASTIIAYFDQIGAIEPVKLNITEINYNSNNTRNSGNWFELKNYGKSELNLTGWKLETGTTYRRYTFPDGFSLNGGEYVIISDDTNLFNTYYSGNNYRKIQIPFSLDNNRDEIEFRNWQDKTYKVVKWTDENPWPICADGHGRTMELIHDSADISNPENWFNGCMGGSPGTPFSSCNEALRVSEINYNSPIYADAGDWFEVYNNKNDTLKIGNWTIKTTQDFIKWKLPSVFNVLPGNRVVFTGDSDLFKSIHPGVNFYYLDGFSLKNNQDVIEFYNPNDTLDFSVGYADDLPFSFKADGKGFTLDLKDSVVDMSSGKSWRTICISGSPGTSSNACEGGIIITEVNFKSATFFDAGDWFELHNTNNNTFDLSGWKITDDTTNNVYTIPAGTSIGPFEYLIFVQDSVKFRKYYSKGIKIIGNFSFSLGSKSDEIKVYNSSNKLVNGMGYKDDLPWPQLVSGRGYTIELSDSDAWLSDGGKWRRSSCIGGSPGTGNKNCDDSIWVSEINYNSPSNADAEDWIELWNPSKNPRNISGWKILDEGLKDTFFIPKGTTLQPNQRIVIAQNTSKIVALHDTISNLTGPLPFGLSSAYEQIVIRDSSNQIRFGMEYNSDSLWTQLPNGNGFTLNLMRNKTDFIDRSSWGVGCPCGTPGKGDGACKTKLEVTEINYFSELSLNSGDWIELENTGKLPIDLYNYRLTGNLYYDYFNIPQGSLIYPGERVVLSNDTIKFDQINPGISRRGNFKFDLSSDTGFIYITDPYNNLITKAFHSSKPGWPLGPYGQGKTLERQQGSANSLSSSSWFEGCLGGSPGEAYFPCRENPVISEVNYMPATYFNTGQWFELTNRSKSDTLHLGQYIIRNSANNVFVIPNGVYLLPGERLVISADTVRLRNFFPGIKMVGNFLFNLSSNDKLKIYNTQGYLIFSLDYNSTGSWPTGASGTGYTLELSDTSYTYNSATSWFNGCFGGSPGEKYLPCSEDIIISEINYKSHTQKNQGDFIELYNNGNNYVNLKGWKLYNIDSSGVNLINQNVFIKPNSYFIVCADTFRFDLQNPGINRIGKLFPLNDSTDYISLINGQGKLITEASYNKLYFWHYGSANSGRSLERSFPITGALNPNSWFTGCIGGSPGIAYSSCNEPLYISEVNYASHSKADAGDWIELYNNTNSNLNISSWKIASLDNSKVHYIKANTILKPYSYYILYSDEIKFKDLFGSYNLDGEKVFFNFDTLDGFYIVNNQSKLISSDGWQNDVSWPSSDRTSYTLERNPNVLYSFNSMGWITGCPGGSPGTSIDNCYGKISITEVNPASNGFYNSGDWIEVGNIRGIPVIPEGFSVQYGANKSNQYLILNKNILFKGDKLILVVDSLMFSLTTGITNFETGLPGEIDDKSDSIYIFNNRGVEIFKSGFSSTISNMKLGYNTGRTIDLLPELNPELTSSWLGGCIGGSPGLEYAKCNYPISITEININPATHITTGSWIEVYNSTSNNINLLGYTIKSSNSQFQINSSFIIPAQGYGIICIDSQSFRTYWPSVTNFIGNYFITPRFKDQISIWDINNNLIWYVDYDSVSPWPSILQNPGRTLELIKTDSNPWNSTSWIAGCIGGTPGREYAVPCDYFGLGIQNSTHDNLINLYPNPGKGIINFGLNPNQEIQSVQVSDLTGKIIYNGTLTRTNPPGLQLQLLENGVYFIDIKVNNFYYRYKYIKM